jgi:hypothetical protein
MEDSAVQKTSVLSDAMKQCIEDCQQCSAECLETAMHHCLESGGRHTEPEHFRLMINCAEICQTAANFMLSRSTFHESLCALCAVICDACAHSCEQIGGMEHCVELCHRCAGSCREMSGVDEPPHILLEERSIGVRGLA